jgi:hypothetical protein
MNFVSISLASFLFFSLHSFLLFLLYFFLPSFFLFCLPTYLPSFLLFLVSAIASPTSSKSFCIRTSLREKFRQHNVVLLIHTFHLFHCMFRPNWPSSGWFYIHCPLECCYYTMASMQNWNLDFNNYMISRQNYFVLFVNGQLGRNCSGIYETYIND